MKKPILIDPKTKTPTYFTIFAFFMILNAIPWPSWWAVGFNGFAALACWLAQEG